MDPKPMTYREWRNQLHKKILANTPQASGEEALDWIWVVDGTAHAELPRIFWELEADPKVMPLYMNTYLDEVSHSGPWFVPCLLSSRIATWIFTQMEFIPLGILFSVKKGTGGLLFEHLQNCVDCLFPPSKSSGKDKPEAGIFRFYDPRILYSLEGYPDQTHLFEIKGPARSLHCWEPGRRLAIDRDYVCENVYICSHPRFIPEELIEYLWQDNTIHTVIGTLGGESGASLRNMPLPEAYEYVACIRTLVERTGYGSATDLGFATALSLLSTTDDWKSVLLYLEKDSSIQAFSLADAYSTAAEILMGSNALPLS